jgi:hypothetical protein
MIDDLATLLCDCPDGEAEARKGQRQHYHLSAFRCPIQAIAEPLLILEPSGDLKACTSLSVHTGWSGIVRSTPVRLAAWRRALRREDLACETAMMAPNYTNMR